MSIGLDDLSKNKRLLKSKSFQITPKTEMPKKERNSVRPWENAPDIQANFEIRGMPSLDAYQESKTIVRQNEEQANFFRQRFQESEVFQKEKSAFIGVQHDSNLAPEADWSYSLPFMNLSLWERLKRMMRSFFAD